MKHPGLLTACLLTLALGAPVSIARGQVNGAVTGTSISVSTVNTGTVLQVNPAVSADRRYVEMSVTPQFSQLDGIDTFVVGGTNGIAGGVVGNGRAPQAVAIRPMKFRPAEIGSATFVDHDRPLLTTPVKPMELKGATLREAIRKLADATKKNLVLGDRGLDLAGADMKAKYDFLLKPADPRSPYTLKDALLTITQTAIPKLPIVITSEDKVITVESRNQADLALVTKTYNLDDLMANLPRIVPAGTDLNTFQKPPEATAGAAKSAAVKQGHAGYVEEAPPREKPHVPTSTSILEVISATVRPEIWKNNGGKSDAYQVGGRVTIKCPAYVHALLEGPSAGNSSKVTSYVAYSQ